MGTLHPPSYMGSKPKQFTKLNLQTIIMTRTMGDNLETITTTSYDVNKIILLTKVLKKFLSAAQQILVSLSISLDTNSMVCLSSRLTSTARAPWK